MKKTVRPQWPAPPRPDSAPPADTGANDKPLSKVTLGLLEEYSLQLESQGYDPYNATIPPGSLRPRRQGRG